MRLTDSRIVLLLCIGAFACTSARATAPAVISSTFDVGPEGWRVENETTTDPAPLWLPNGGNAGGAISGIDAGETFAWQFAAPDSYFGDRSAFYGGTLHLELRYSIAGPQLNAFLENFVILRTEGYFLAYLADPYPVPGVWTSFDIPLIGANWIMSGIGGGPATEFQMQEVLSDLRGLTIRGEWHRGADQGFLDNVAMTAPASVPEPTSGVLQVAGLLAIAALSLRRRLRQSWHQRRSLRPAMPSARVAAR